MARAKRRSFTRRRSRGPRKDWVYRGDVPDQSSPAVGSYSWLGKTVGNGNNSLGVILYDSQNYLRRAINVEGGAAGDAVFLNAAARAEGHKATIHAVEGVIRIRPNTWLAGFAIGVGFRLGLFEQDTIVGGLEVDPGYAMWNTVGLAPEQDADVWANIGHMRDWRMWRFSDGTVTQPVWHLPIRWSSSRGIRIRSPDMCLGLYCEASDPVVGAQQVNALCQFWLRTLVSDEG